MPKQFAFFDFREALLAAHARHQRGVRLQTLQERRCCLRRVIGRLLRIVDRRLDLHQLGSQIRYLRLIHAQSSRQPWQRRINAVEEIFFVPILILCRRQHGIHQPVKGIVWTCINRPSARSLRQLMPQPLHRKLRICHSQQRILLARAQAHCVILRSALIAAERTHIIEIEFLRLPGQQAFLDLFRKLAWIRRRSERFARQNARCLMVAMPIPIRSLKA